MFQILEKSSNISMKFCRHVHIKEFFFKDKNWRPKVITTKDYNEAGIKILKKKCEVTVCKTHGRDEFLEKVKGVDGIIWSPYDKFDLEMIEAAGPNFKAMSSVSVGLDHINVAELKKRNIALGHTPEVMKYAVAEIAVGLAIAANRRFHEGRLQIEKNGWLDISLIGNDWVDSTVGIVGFGKIGQTICELLSGFKVKRFVYCGRSVKPEAASMQAEFVNFEELIRECDFILIACPMTAETNKMFSFDAFSKMKKKCTIINVGRGPVIDQEALYLALKNGQIFSAGLDVTDPEPLPADHPLLTLPNCVITPHLGSASVKARENMAILAALNVIAGLAGERMHSPAY